MLTNTVDLSGNAGFGNADVWSIVDKYSTILWYVMRKCVHSGKTSERESIQSSHLERPQHFVCALGIFHGVHIIAANTVGKHDLVWRNVVMLVDQIQQAMHCFRSCKSIWKMSSYDA